MNRYWFIRSTSVLFFCTCVLAQLRGQDSLSFGSIDLPAATVSAGEIAVSPLAQRFTIEEVRRLPATFYDPARLVALLPGTVQTNDQANHLSVRGNSPTKNQWRLNGLVIANPNHAANAGTFYDLPTFNGGGVNILSAQLLDQGAFYADGLPAEYGGAAGGLIDMRLRPGSKQGAAYQLQASFIGLDGTVETPVGGSGRTSILANVRSSFTGLLAAAGVDFGGEEIGFNDLNLHLHRNTKRGEWSVFFLYGQSYNRFAAVDPATDVIEEQKDLYDINFSAGTGAIGFSSVAERPKGRFNFGFALSGTGSDRDQERRDDRQTDYYQSTNQTVMNLQYSYERYLTATASLKFGIEGLLTDYDAYLTFFEENRFSSFESYNIVAHAAPYLSFTKLLPRGSVYLGLRPELNSDENSDRFLLLPRFRYTGQWGDRRLVLSAEAVNGQTFIFPPAIADLSGNYTVTWRGSLAYGQRIGSVSARATAFLQYTDKEAATQIGDFLYSANNLLEVDPNLRFRALTATRRYGLELEAGGGTRADGWYYRGNATLLNAETFQPDDSWARDRYAVDFIGKLTVGREWPGVGKGDLPRTFGFNAALIAHGGERAGRVIPPVRTGRIPDYFTPQDFSRGFTEQNGTYFRPDVRVYLTKVRERRTSTLALDLQNAAGIRNVSDRYYDTFLERPVERTSLGLIPVLSYRIAWQ